MKILLSLSSEESIHYNIRPRLPEGGCCNVNVPVEFKLDVPPKVGLLNKLPPVPSVLFNDLFVPSNDKLRVNPGVLLNVLTVSVFPIDVVPTKKILNLSFVYKKTKCLLL